MGDDDGEVVSGAEVGDAVVGADVGEGVTRSVSPKGGLGDFVEALLVSVGEAVGQGVDSVLHMSSHIAQN